MDEVTESWRPQPVDVYVGSRVRPEQPANHNKERRMFLWKAGLLLISTVALIPILALQSDLGAKIYLAFLIIVHVAGLAIFAKGLRRKHFGTTARGLAIRLSGLVALTALLYAASKGLGDFGSAMFWFSLFAIWALHTIGAAVLHLMPEQRESDSLCPFF